MPEATIEVLDIGAVAIPSKRPKVQASAEASTHLAGGNLGTNINDDFVGWGTSQSLWPITDRDTF